MSLGKFQRDWKNVRQIWRDWKNFEGFIRYWKNFGKILDTGGILVRLRDIGQSLRDIGRFW